MKIYENWKNELINSMKEQDVIQLRKKLNEIQILTDNQLQSYGINSTDNEDYRR